MERVRLIHWNADEAVERAEHLSSFGYIVDNERMDGPATIRQLGNDPPAAIVIDLSRLPSQGRDLALLLRKRKATRHVPLVFAGGSPEKVARIKKLLPDAVYTPWAQIRASLQNAITTPPSKPVVPQSQFEAYAGTPLPQKLGIKANSVVGLVHAPEGIEGVLGQLPEGVRLYKQTHGECDLTIWFTRSRNELDQKIGQMAALAGGKPLWIAWPKKASDTVSDLTQQQVREVGLAAGLVDYKVCSIDKTWSGLLFTQRKSKK